MAKARGICKGELSSFLLIGEVFMSWQTKGVTVLSCLNRFKGVKFLMDVSVDLPLFEFELNLIITNN